MSHEYQEAPDFRPHPEPVGGRLRPAAPAAAGTRSQLGVAHGSGRRAGAHGFNGAGRRFTIKGGVALEMRLRDRARATRDLDLVLLSPEGDPVEELRLALADEYEGFAFRLRAAPQAMPNRAFRLEASLQYLGKSWGAVQVDVSRSEGSGTEVEMVEAISLRHFGLQGPESLPCLSLPHHVAQKIHGVTLPPAKGRRNERFRDLIDLLLLREWVRDLDAVRHACLDVFARRGTHAWPPVITIPDHWAGPFAAMAREVGVTPEDVHSAAIEIRQFLSRIDESATGSPAAATRPEPAAATMVSESRGKRFASGSRARSKRAPAFVHRTRPPSLKARRSP